MPSSQYFFSDPANDPGDIAEAKAADQCGHGRLVSASIRLHHAVNVVLGDESLKGHVGVERMKLVNSEVERILMRVDV